MTITLFFDTETTGLPIWSSPSGDPAQPHMTQFAGMMFRDDHLLASMNFMSRPDGWEIPAEITELTGITMEDANKFGLPEETVYRMALKMIRDADTIVAHNIPFDARIMRIAAKRFGTEDEAEEIKAKRRECTMTLGARELKARGMTGTGKSLGEVHKAIVGCEISGAHNALVDVVACRQIWLKIKENA